MVVPETVACWRINTESESHGCSNTSDNKVQVGFEIKIIFEDYVVHKPIIFCGSDLLFLCMTVYGPHFKVS